MMCSLAERRTWLTDSYAPSSVASYLMLRHPRSVNTLSRGFLQRAARARVRPAVQHLESMRFIKRMPATASHFVPPPAQQARQHTLPQQLIPLRPAAAMPIGHVWCETGRSAHGRSSLCRQRSDFAGRLWQEIALRQSND
jgi:hypothetical protein